MLTGALARMRGRLAVEQGFTLIEMLVAIALGIVVLTATLTLVDSSGRATTRISDKAETVQRLRVAMNKITRLTRTQVCKNGTTPPIAAADASSVRFWSDMSTTSDDDSPDLKAIVYDASAGTVTENTYPVQAGGGYDLTNPTRRVLLTNASLVGTTPFLTYYSWDNASTPMNASAGLDNNVADDGNTVPANSVAKVVRVDFSLAASPSNGNTDPKRRATMTASVYTRNADFSGQADPGRKWGPRCD